MNSSYPPSTPDIARKRRELAPAQQAAFDAFGKAVFAEGSLSAKTKQIIAVAVAHVVHRHVVCRQTPAIETFDCFRRPSVDPRELVTVEPSRTLDL